jgi:hypothetical protein
VARVLPFSGRRPGRAAGRARTPNRGHTAQDQVARAVAELSHLSARVVRRSGQLRVHRVLHGAHHVHARLPKGNVEGGHRAQRVLVHFTVAGPVGHVVVVRMVSVRGAH